MAVAAAPPGSARESVRLKRERDQEVLVWPDLVFIEFIAAVLFTITFVVLALAKVMLLTLEARAGVET